MSSIERYIEKMGQSAQSPKAEELPPMPAVPPSPCKASPGQASKQAVSIDFVKLKAAGMLTPDTSQEKLSEEYRAIKRPLLRNAFGRAKLAAGSREHANLIMVTSSLPSEGKSFTAINLAMSMAMERDYTVLLVEADVGRPAVCRYCGIDEPGLGLVDYLADQGRELSELLLRTNVPKLSILPAGKYHPSSSELLGSEAMHALMAELSSRYPDRVVIFDSPPLLVSNEAVTLSSMVGQIVFVIEAVRTERSKVRQALELLDGGAVVGAVLNKFRGKSSAVYGYGYGAAKREA